MKNTYGVDGVMIGRASIGNPWIFNNIKHFLSTGKHLPPPTIRERVRVCKQHLDFSIRWKGDRLGLIEMRTHYSNYFKGFDHFKDFRLKLVTCDSYTEIQSTFEQIIETYRSRDIAA